MVSELFDTAGRTKRGTLHARGLPLDFGGTVRRLFQWWTRRRVADTLAIAAGIGSLAVGLWWLATGDPAPGLESGAEPSIWDRALTSRILDLLRLLLLVAGAFFVAAVVQRSVTGDFRFKAGGVEFPELEARNIDVTTDAFQELSEAIEGLDEKERTHFESVLGLLNALRLSTQAELARIHQELESREEEQE